MPAPKSERKKKDTKHLTVEATPIRRNSFHSLFLAALPGIIIAIASTFWSRGGDGGGRQNVTSIGDPDSIDASLKQPGPESWTYGYYTTEIVTEKNTPSTHALLYPNGGGGTPDIVSFANREEFLKLGRLYNDLGQIVQSPSHFPNGTALYRGPQKPGTHFQWPAVHVGYRRPVPGVFGGDGKQIELETLTEPTIDAASSDPRVFYIHNFLSSAEADEFIRFSTSPDNPYKMAPSTGGTHKAWNQGGSAARLTTRTSENAFDVTTQNSVNVKQRAFRLLRMGAYEDNLADGIQVLRYELGQAYVAHHDYFPEFQSEDHQWNPLLGGSNRFATIFLYLSDVEHGGETSFPNSDRLTIEKSKELVERLGQAPPIETQIELMRSAGLAEGSWEENLSMACSAKFAVPPRRGDAILFYSQRPDGQLDQNSLHGACPVLKGTKWGANLWVWNACRYSLCRIDPMNPAGELRDELKAPFPAGV